MSDAKAYLYVELEVTDRQGFREEYMRRAQPVLKKFGARVLVATEIPEVLEGSNEGCRVVLLEFESSERARQFYQSAEYQELIPVRLSAAMTRTYKLLQGLPRHT